MKTYKHFNKNNIFFKISKNKKKKQKIKYFSFFYNLKKNNILVETLIILQLLILYFQKSIYRFTKHLITCILMIFDYIS